MGLLNMMTVMASIKCTNDMKVIDVNAQIAMAFFVMAVGSPGVVLIHRVLRLNI